MKRPIIFIALASLGLGCDLPFMDDERSGLITIDARPLLHRSVDDRQVLCRTVAREAVLSVNNRRVESIPLTDVTGDVTFEDVRVRRGTARFEVAILSTNDALLYSGSAEANIEDEPFQVGVELEHRNGVLRVCPGEISIANGRGNLFLENIGDRDIDVTIDPPNATCDGPCVHFPFTSFRLPAGEGGTMTISRGPGASGTYEARVSSNVGEIMLTIHTN
jgi:hypothetical protein